MSSRQTFFQKYLDDESSSDDDDFYMMASTALLSNSSSNVETKHRGSVPGHAVIHRDRESGHARMFQDYLADNPTFGPHIFRRRFRMSKELFIRIMKVVEDHDEYFVQKRNAANVLGLSCFQKVTAALRMLTYGTPTDATDEYVRIGESTAIESLRKFVAAVVEIFEEKYLRHPNKSDIAHLMELGAKRGFPGMLGSIDCMHWVWKNCPYEKQGQYKGHENRPTIILEAVASHDLHIWHAFFGMPGSLNDINVLHRSPLFANLAEGTAPEVNYTINGHDYKMGYYLADGIYPPWATLVKTINHPEGNKRKYFAKAQEAARKDVERAFGVLQARFAIIREPARFWDTETLGLIMKACVIMHNMIIEDEVTVDPDERFDDDAEDVRPGHGKPTRTLNEFIEAHEEIRDKETHNQLKEDLIEHLWNHHPDLYSS